MRVVPDSGRSILGEGALRSPRENAVFWVDILGCRLNRLSLVDDKVTRWDMPEPIGWVIERAGGGFVTGFASGFAELDLKPLAIRNGNDGFVPEGIDVGGNPVAIADARSTGAFRY